MRKAGMIFCAAVGFLALCISVILMMVTAYLPRSAPQSASEPPYVLRENAGRVGLYETNGTQPVAEFAIYPDLLPESDAAALRKEIPVENRNALTKLLEDFGA